MNIYPEVIRHLAIHAADNSLFVRDSVVDTLGYIIRNDPLDIRTNGAMGSEISTPFNIDADSAEAFARRAVQVAEAFGWNSARIAAASRGAILAAIAAPA